jgi:hypothetical protein
MKKDNIIPLPRQKGQKNKIKRRNDVKKETKIREIKALPLHKLLHEILFDDTVK